MPPILVPSSIKRIATRILVTTLRKCDFDLILPRKQLLWENVILIWSFPATNCLFKVSYWSTRRCRNCSKLRTKTQEGRQWHCSGVFIFNCEHISCYVLIVGSHFPCLHWNSLAIHLPFYKFCSLED